MSKRTAVSLFFLINGFVFASWATRLPDLQEIYEIDYQQLGYVLLVHSIGSVISMPVTGWLIHTFGSKVITTVTGLIFPVFLLCLPFAPSYLLLFLPFLLMGAATGMLDVAMNAQAVDVEREMGKPIMTMFHAVFSIGMVFGSMIGGYFLSSQWTLSEHLFAVSIVSMITLMISSSYLHTAAREIEKMPLFLMPKGPVVLLGVIAFCCMMGEGAITDWSTNYMKSIVKVPEWMTTFGLTAFAGFMTLGRLVGDRGRVAVGDDRLLQIGATLSITGLCLVLSLIHPIIVIIGFACVGLGLSNIVPIIYSMAGNLKDIHAGSGIAMATTIGYSGFMVGPPVIGFIADASSLRYGLGVLFILFVLQYIFILLRKKNAIND